MRPPAILTLPVAAGCVAVALAAGCSTTSTVPPLQANHGDPGRGAKLIDSYGCGTCHSIPGIGDAHGLVGPPLDHFARRSYIAGMLPNSERNLQRWIEHPQSVVPGNAMPNLGVSKSDAADITAYLYTLD
jgi:cytochrome c2